jgi:hypothetical protein
VPAGSGLLIALLGVVLVARRRSTRIL